MKLTNLLVILDFLAKGSVTVVAESEDLQKEVDMTINIPKTYAEMQQLELKDMQDLWRVYFNTESKPIKKSMMRSLWYEIQCRNQELKLEQKYITRLNRYASDPNLHIQKSYKGRKYVVNIIADNKFEYDGEIYNTLSAAAKAICNKKVSGYDFFGLNNKHANKDGLR